ncbi:MAG TPA: hypothetical protein VMX58_06990 [Patescibacteria group bacterium]|nr:hypothetical protein [Patescibacteria group bacterium]
MLKRSLPILLAFALLAAAVRPAGAGAFKLRSRSLLEGPVLSGTFTDDGFILGTGGGIVIFHDMDNLDDWTYLPIGGEPRDIVTFYEVAYIAANRGGLVTVDITDPSKPIAMNRFDKSRRAIRCAVHERTLVLLDVDNTLFTFDLTIPLEPLQTGIQYMKYIPLWMANEEELVAVIGSRKGALYTIQEDHTLRKCSDFAFAENTKRGIIHDRILYTIAMDGSIRRWNLEDPAAPVEMSPLPVESAADISFVDEGGLILTSSHKVIPFTYRGGKRGDTTEERGHARDGDPDGAGAIEIGNPLKLTGHEKLGDGGGGGGLLARIRSSFVYGKFLGSGVVFDGTRFAMLAGKRGVFFFSLGEDSARYLGGLTTPGFAIDCVASGGLLYVANGNDGLRIGEVHDDGSIDWIGHLETTEARDLVVNGSVVALCDGSAGFKTIDVSDPRNPRIIGSSSSPFFNSAIACRDGRAYIAGGLGGVEVLDITDTAHPRLVWRDEFSEVRGIHVDSRYLYFADGFEGFRIFSIMEEKPVPVAVLDTEGWNCDCFVLDDLAYLADGGNGIKVVDVADRENPTLVGAVDTGALTRNVHAVPGLVFAAVHTSGIAAVDVSDPANPFIAARYRTVDDGRGVWVDERFVYLASGSGGVYVFTYEP